ncbi:MAG: hypothetical protein ACODAJ_03155 [Planctomycetota bacterium]
MSAAATTVPAGDAVPTGGLSRDPFRASARFVWVLALVQIAYQVALLTKGLDSVVRITCDDAYYYLQTAWNLKLFGFPTFDGINPTNGVQFLWYWLLALVALAVPTKMAFLYVSLILCIAANALCYFAIYRMGKLLARPVLLAAAAGLWFYLGSRHVLLMGMENSVHGLVFWLLLVEVVRLTIRSRRGEPTTLLWATVLLVLNVWCRLDAAVFSAGLYLYTLHESVWRSDRWLKKRPSRKAVAASALLAGTGAAVMFTGFWLMGGSFFPVSGLVKLSQASWKWPILLEIAARGLDLTNVFLRPVLDLHPMAGLGVVLALMVTTWVLVAGSYGRSSTMGAGLCKLWGFMAVASVVQLLVQARLGDYVHYGKWYQTPYYVFCILSTALCADGLVYHLRRLRLWKLITPTVVVVLLVIVLCSAQRVSKWLRREARETNAAVARLRAAEWMSGHLDPDAICCAHSAGAVGYFSGRTVVNLDGLINSYSFFSRVLTGEKDCATWLKELGAEYYVDETDAAAAFDRIGTPIANFPADIVVLKLHYGRRPQER